jgi:DNA-binding winged helix-turn-helix (wHTH) protein
MAHGDRSVDVFIRKVRQKLEKASSGWNYIHTHFGVGYRFEPEPRDGPAPAPAAAEAGDPVTEAAGELPKWEQGGVPAELGDDPELVAP